MRRIVALAATVTLLAGFACAASAQSGFGVVGDPYTANSWGQGFYETGVGPFDTLRIDMISGGPFETPWINNWSAPGWSVYSVIGSTSVGASGPDQTYLQFDIRFAGIQSTPLSFVFQAFNDGTLLERAKATWNGSVWSIAAYGPDGIPSAPLATPEASSLMLLLPGLAPLGLALRRRVGR